MRSDIYPKISQSHTNLYFPALSDSYSNCRIAALQHQLHVSTTPNVNTLAPSNANWANLVIPCKTAGTSAERYNNSPIEQEIDIVTSEEENVQITENDKPEGKKKNPYSIEELLKKPSKRPKPLQISTLGVHQPFGIILNNTDVDCYRENVNNSDEVKM